jgi:hypothetical protein
VVIQSEVRRLVARDHRQSVTLGTLRDARLE